MSHLTSVQTQLKDRTAIEAACKSLGWTIHENRRNRFYRGEAEMCEFVAEFGEAEASLTDTYNVGFQRQADGTYRVLIDNSMRGPMIYEEGKLGGQTPRILNALKQSYAREVLTRKARALGASVNVQQRADGSLVLDMKGGRFGAR